MYNKLTNAYTLLTHTLSPILSQNETIRIHPQHGGNGRCLLLAGVSSLQGITSLCTISFKIPSYLALAPFSNQSHISFFLPLLGIDIDDPKKQIKMGLFFCTFLKKWFCPWNQIFIGFSLNFKGDKHNFQSFFICENLIECTGHVW